MAFARRTPPVGRPGIRVQLVCIRERRLEMDFKYEGDDRSFHVLNAVSPGFTCACPSPCASRTRSTDCGPDYGVLVTRKTSKAGPVWIGARGDPPTGAGGVTPSIGMLIEPPL